MVTVWLAPWVDRKDAFASERAGSAESGQARTAGKRPGTMGKRVKTTGKWRGAEDDNGVVAVCGWR